MSFNWILNKLLFVSNISLICLVHIIVRCNLQGSSIILECSFYCHLLTNCRKSALTALGIGRLDLIRFIIILGLLFSSSYLISLYITYCGVRVGGITMDHIWTIPQLEGFPDLWSAECRGLLQSQHKTEQGQRIMKHRNTQSVYSMEQFFTRRKSWQN